MPRAPSLKLFGVLMLATFPVAASGADSTSEKETRRGFFTKIRDAYIEGRMSANEKRIEERKTAEKIRRRAVFERNVKSLVDGISKRLKHRRSNLGIVIIGGFALGIWLCHKGSLGCEKDETKESPQHHAKGWLQ